MNVKTKELEGTPFTLTLSLKNRIAFSLFLKSAGHSGETRSFQRHGAVPRPDPAGRVTAGTVAPEGRSHAASPQHRKELCHHCARMGAHQVPRSWGWEAFCVPTGQSIGSCEQDQSGVALCISQCTVTASGSPRRSLASSARCT